MHTVGGTNRSAAWHWILAALVILGSMSGVASAQIDVNETGLHDGEIVYGFEVPGAPIPYTNLDAITLWGWGETDLNLYADVSFYAYGLSSDVNLVNVGAVEVNAVGGIVDINDGDAYAGILNAGGIRVSGDVSDTGDIMVNATGGTANTHGDLAVANATADAQGIFNNSGSIFSNALVDVNSVGGSATGKYSAFAEGNAHGIYIASGNVTNIGVLNVSAAGGTADANTAFTGEGVPGINAYSDANAVAYGLLAQGDVISGGTMDITARGGDAQAETHADIHGSVTSDAYARANAYARGIYATGNLNDESVVWITTLGGTASADVDVDAVGWAGANACAYAYSDANTYGLYGDGYVTSASHMSITTLGSTANAWASIDIGSTQEAEANPYAYAYARADAYGIHAGDDADNRNTIAMIVNGGMADANAVVERAYIYGEAYALAMADANVAAHGVWAGDDVTNSGNIVMIAVGRTAAAHADADVTAHAWADADTDVNAYAVRAYGDVDSTGDINIIASGGTTQADARAATETYAYASADAKVYGIYTDGGNVANTSSIGINVSGGTADANATGDGDASALATANADAYGIKAAEDVNSTGAFTVSAVAGEAYAGANASSDAYAYTIANADAYGISADANIANSGAITTFASGGTADAVAFSEGDTHFSVSASALAVGLYASGDVDNTGVVDANAVGGHATAQSGADPNADAYAVGIRAADAVTNSGELTVAATGGTVDANDSSVHANASATGISTAGTTSNTGDITATAIGGTATSDYYAEVTASATGITTSGADADIYNSGALAISAIGGTAADSYILNYAGNDTSPDASAYGISTVADVNNTGLINVTAAGGTGVNTAGDPDHIGYANLYAMTDAVGIRAHDVNNTAGISATAIGADLTVATTGKTTAFAYDNASAVGIVAEMDTTNSGDISATAVGGDVTATADTYASAYSSPVAHGIYADGNVTNSGVVTVQALAGAATSTSNAYASSYGVGIEDCWPSQTVVYSLVNSGTIMVTSVGGDAEAQDDSLDSAATAQGYGITFCSDIANSGDITTLAIGGTVDTSNTAYAYAYTTGISTGAIMVDEGEDVVPMVLTNSGAITGTALGGTADSNGLTDAYAGAVGVAFQGGVDNDGTITVTAIGGTADSHDGVKDDVYADYSATAYAEAHGLNAYYGDVNNTAPVVLVAMGGTADAQDSAGAYAYARGLVAYGDVNNTGTISVAATGGTADANGTTDAYATAYGIHARGDVNNAGPITAVAAGGTATGDDADGTATAYGIYAQGNVSNTAAITVVGDTEDGFTSHVYGIYMDATGNLTNTGVIRTEGDDTYEVYVASGTTTLVDTYNVTLDGDPAQASFFIADGATLALNDATLTVAEVQGDTRWYTQYRLFAIDSNGVVAGNFAGIEAVNPDVNAVYYTHATADTVDDTVALEYGPRASENIASAAVEKQLVSQATDVVNYHMTSTLLQNILSPNTSNLLADAGSTAESFALAQAAPKKAAGVFFEPYYSRIDKEANPLGYDAGLWGFCLGYEQYVGDSLLGLHLGVGQSDIDYAGVGYSANSEDQDVVTGGFSGLTRWDPWTLRYGLTAFHGSHDYKGLTGLSLDEHETASYNSYGTSATLMAGHIFRKGSHIWLPEAGLNWLWAHRERYTTKATDPSWDTTYSAMNDHDLQAEAAIRWLGSFTHDEIHVAPSASVGIRHLLTDAETSARQSVTDASPVDVKSERDRTAMTLSGSVTLTRTPHALSLAYDGEYSPDTQRHNVWLRYSWLF